MLTEPGYRAWVVRSMHPPIRNILGQVKRKVDFRFTMDRQRVFIANLSKGRLGADKANLLGSLLVTQFQLAAMSQATVAESDRRDFHLFIGPAYLQLR